MAHDDAAFGSDDKIAIIVDLAALMCLARKPIEIRPDRGCESAVLPDIESMHEMARKALDDLFRTDFGKAFLVERGQVRRDAGVGGLGPCRADGRAEH